MTHLRRLRAVHVPYLDCLVDGGRGEHAPGASAEREPGHRACMGREAEERRLGLPPVQTHHLRAAAGR